MARKAVVKNVIKNEPGESKNEWVRGRRKKRRDEEFERNDIYYGHRCKR